MKNIVIKVFSICIVALFAGSCGKNCEVKRPKDLKPINWESYNDVYTVRWNFVSTASGSCRKTGPTGLTLKVCGWIVQGNPGEIIDPGMFLLVDDRKYIFASGGTIIYIKTFDKDLVDLLKTKLAITDITKKCFIKGELYYFCYQTMGRCPDKVAPEVHIHDINDIYFED
jgi:hypothetical protein